MLAPKRIFFPALAFVLLLAAPAGAQSPVTLTIENSPGPAIPADFTGVSFGTVAELPGHGGVSGHLFSPTNQQLINLFRNAGLHNLRLGGSTVEGTNAAVPDHNAIDDVFGFARAASIKVIYSLRLLNGDPATDAATAQYIWQRYRPQLKCFAIGNEPDIRRFHYPPNGTGSDPTITDYQTYLAAWRKFALAVTNAVPDAKFAGPDAANDTYAGRFAQDEVTSGIVTLITQHFYAGGSPYLDQKGPPTISAQTAISNMLSTKWVNKKYPALHEKAIVPVVATGLPYRMTESDDYLKGVAHASDAFASALWSLDYLHWWAAHGSSGVDFHNTEWLKTDTIRPDSEGNFQITPKAYGIKMFELGSQGNVQKLTISNPDKVNLTAYAVKGGDNLFVTIINKEFDEKRRAARVTIAGIPARPSAAQALALGAPNGDLTATNGITLGGAPISNRQPWQGSWKNIPAGADGKISVTVPPASALLVKL